MREITIHRAEGDANPGLKIYAVDKPGLGGASSIYHIAGVDLAKNAAAEIGDDVIAKIGEDPVVIFQHGSIPQCGVNGMSNEAMLAIVIDRLEGYQSGEFPSQENATALANAKDALRALHKRTQARIKRGVEGQMVA